MPGVMNGMTKVSKMNEHKGKGGVGYVCGVF